MKNYVISGYIFGVAWGLAYGFFRSPHLWDKYPWYEAFSIVMVVAFTVPGLIGALSGLVAGLSLRQRERAKQRRQAAQIHPQ